MSFRDSYSYAQRNIFGTIDYVSMKDGRITEADSSDTKTLKITLNNEKKTHVESKSKKKNDNDGERKNKTKQECSVRELGDLWECESKKD